MTQISHDLSFLAGGGEMSELIRAKDWSKTPLGDIDSWSPSLRMMVSFLLSNRFPLLLWWGPEYIQIYNDPYRPVLGSKHPRSLGQPVSECWSEIWHIIGPLIDTPFRGGPATWMDDLSLEINRHGFFEETHFTVAYSPVPDDTVPTRIGGVLATVHEISQQVVQERRVAALRDLGARAVEAKSAEEACAVAAETLSKHPKDIPFALLYLIDPDRERARLAGIAGIAQDGSASPEIIALGEPVGEEQAWPLAAAMRTETLEIVKDLSARFGNSVPPGPWFDPPQRAVVAPIRSNIAHQLAGFLVAGISSRLKLDESYCSFIELAASQIATAVASARAYEEERKRAEALAELDRAKTAFFSNVSHEFRTPLTLMLAPVEDLLSRSHTDLAPDAKGQLEMVNRNGLRLLRLVNTLLDFSRIEAGRMQASYEATDLAAFTTELASVFRAATERAGLRLIVDCAALPRPVFVDRDMWEKIVLNLISNAFKFTFEGEIAISLKRTGTQAELRVRDTGVGIPAEEMPRLFERFHRIKTARSRTHEGSGIGLALVQELVKLHDGTIHAESVPGEGTTFIVSIPLGAAHLPADRIGGQRVLASTATGAAPFVEEALRWLPQEIDDRESESEDSQSSGNLSSVTIEQRSSTLHPQAPTHDSRPRVIVADDNADMRQYLTRLLSEHYDIVAVPDGEAALAATREGRADLFISDVMMPSLDGFDLLKQLRADNATRSIPVILLSARAGEESRIEGLDVGADDYLVKPFSARELIARVESHLKLARIRRESAERITAILESITDGFYVVDADWHITYINPAAGRMLAAHGVDVDTLVGKHVWGKAFPQARGSLAERELRRAMIERLSVEFENFCEPWQRWYAMRGYPIEEGGLAIYFSDITERRQQAEMMRENEAQLAADLADSQQLQRISTKLIEGGSLDLLHRQILDAAAAIMHSEMASIQMYHPGQNELRLLAHKGFHPDSAAFWQSVKVDSGSTCGEALRAGRRVIAADVEACAFMAGTTDLEVYRNSGIRAVQSTPLRSRTGQLLGMISSHWREPHEPAERELRLFDILARQAADLIEGKQAEEALREADRRKDEFLAILGHELRNPLGVISNIAQVMRKKKVWVDSGLEELEEAMTRQVGQMARLLDDLLDVSRVARGQVRLKKEPCDLTEIVGKAAEDHRSLLEENELLLLIELPDTPLWVIGDPTRLAQIVGNTLHNANKFTDSGGRVTVRLQKMQSREEALLTVRDTGIGMEPVVLAHAFEPFSQAEHSIDRSRGGLGLGLALVKGLVELQGGKVAITSDGPGLGVELAIRFPLTEAPAQVAKPVEPMYDGPRACRILIIEDNQVAAKSTKMFLAASGHTVEVAHDGQTGIETARRFRPEVVLCDIGLPVMDGYAVCQALRKEPGLNDAFLIAITGYGQEEDERRTRDVGFDAHLTKPVDLDGVERLLSQFTAQESKAKRFA